MMLEGLDGKPLQPKYANGSTWLSHAKSSEKYSNSFVARMVRCITDHAPIGLYYQRFNIQAETTCPCGEEEQDRYHITIPCKVYGKVGCPVHHDVLDMGERISCIDELITYLEEKPLAFGFERPDPPRGEG